MYVCVQRSRKHFVTDLATKWARPEKPKDETQRAEGGGVIGYGFYPSTPARGLEDCFPSRSGQNPADMQFYGNFRLRKPA